MNNKTKQGHHDFYILRLLLLCKIHSINSYLVFYVYINKYIQRKNKAIAQ